MSKSSRYIIRIRSSRYLTFDPGIMRQRPSSTQMETLLPENSAARNQSRVALKLMKRPNYKLNKCLCFYIYFFPFLRPLSITRRDYTIRHAPAVLPRNSAHCHYVQHIL